MQNLFVICLEQAVPKPLAGADGMVCSCLQRRLLWLQLTPPDTSDSENVSPCSADSRPPAIWKLRAGLQKEQAGCIFMRTSPAVFICPALPVLDDWGGDNSLFPEYHEDISKEQI